MEKEKMMKVAYEKGCENEKDYGGCAQCAIAAIQDAIGIRNDFVYKSGSSLAGGTGECIDGNCGGYTGAGMMISLFFGRTREEEGSKKGKADKYVTLRLTAAIHDKFVEKYSGVRCIDVQTKVFGRPYNLRSDEDKKLFREAGAHEDDDKCCAAIGDSARWCVEVILGELEKNGLTIEDFKDLNQVDSK